jgi:hypothetical protein
LRGQSGKEADDSAFCMFDFATECHKCRSLYGWSAVKCHKCRSPYGRFGVLYCIGNPPYALHDLSDFTCLSELGFAIACVRRAASTPGRPYAKPHLRHLEPGRPYTQRQLCHFLPRQPYTQWHCCRRGPFRRTQAVSYRLHPQKDHPQRADEHRRHRKPLRYRRGIIVTHVQSYRSPPDCTSQTKSSFAREVQRERRQASPHPWRLRYSDTRW